jgi:hypothetical protein
VSGFVSGTATGSGTVRVASAVRVTPLPSGRVTVSFWGPVTDDVAGSVTSTGTGLLPAAAMSWGATVATAPGIVVVAVGVRVANGPAPAYSRVIGTVTVAPGVAVTGPGGPARRTSRSGTVAGSGPPRIQMGRQPEPQRATDSASPSVTPSRQWVQVSTATLSGRAVPAVAPNGGKAASIWTSSADAPEMRLLANTTQRLPAPGAYDALTQSVSAWRLVNVVPGGAPVTERTGSAIAVGTL